MSTDDLPTRMCVTESEFQNAAAKFVRDQLARALYADTHGVAP